MTPTPQNYGIVYVITNPAMPDIVKIGMTNRDTIDARLKELFNTKFGNDAKKCSFSFFLKTLFFINNLSRKSCLLISSTLFPSYYSANKEIREMLASVCFLLRSLLENKVFSKFFYERFNPILIKNK